MGMNTQRQQRVLGRASAAVRTRLRRFLGDQDGAVFVFAMVIFVLMLIAGGFAIDVVRAENQRVQIQQTLDRAVLAAANLDNDADPQLVVEDYFAKAGFSEFLVDVTVEETFNSKTVTATTKSDVNTLFMQLAGVDSLAANGSGGAQEKVTDIEISLVVDISGSMGWWNSDYSDRKINNLRSAAYTFFDEVIKDQTEETGITMISIVPYNATVNVGENLLSYFNATDWHEENHCIRFFDDDFDERRITRNQLLERVGHFYERPYSYQKPNNTTHPWCDNKPGQAILPFETSETALDAHIAGLTAGGMTGIDNGMKWASALLDPKVRPILKDMVDLDERSAIVRNWPRNYDADGTMKVIVLMTDGVNTEQWDLIGDYKRTPNGKNSAKSLVYYSDTEGEDDEFQGWFVKFPDNPGATRWYQPGSPWTTDDDKWMKGSQTPDDLERKSYQDLWVRFSTVDAATYFYYYSDPDGEWEELYDYSAGGYYWSWNGTVPQLYTDLLNPTELHDSYGQVDTRLDAMCNTIKDENVLIFTIAFEAPTHAEEVMKSCATKIGYYYDVASTDLSDAFRSIASQIDHLRLIQ